MNRTLRRPMFRIGGSAEGITSGLQPRQGYANNNAYDQLVKQIPNIQEQAEKLSYQPRGTNVYDFLTEFGLDIASRPPVPGGILATAATAAKDPYARFMQRKGEADVQRYASESDMFKTLIGAQADILSAESGEGMAGKTEQWKFEQVPKLIDTISEIEAIPVDERTTEQQNALDTAKINLGRLEKEDPYISWFLKSDESGKLFKNIKNKLYNDGLQQDPPTYSSEEDPKLRNDTYKEFQRQVKEMGKAEGGRVGYANAGAVMPGAMPTDQGPAPEDTAGITYEELRARLPQEVTDDIVRLPANSAEALEDFAMIQTEQDINIFNKKYGVNLVLPSEG